MLTAMTPNGVIARMDLKIYLKSLGSEEQREDFAQRCETSLGHIRNVGYGYKPCATDLAVRIERESAGQVTRPELRADWADHWPELVDQAATAGQR